MTSWLCRYAKPWGVLIFSLVSALLLSSRCLLVFEDAGRGGPGLTDLIRHWRPGRAFLLRMSRVGRESGISHSCGVENYSAWIWPARLLRDWPACRPVAVPVPSSVKWQSDARLRLVLQSVSPSAETVDIWRLFWRPTKGSSVFLKVLLL